MTDKEMPSFMIGAAIADFVVRVVPRVDDDRITWVHFPDLANNKQACQGSKFAAVELSSGAIGIAFTAYIPTDPENVTLAKQENIIGRRASEFVRLIGKPSSLPVERTLSMAVVNALSVAYMKERGLMQHLEFTDAVEALAIQPTDVVGMVGMFPPLVQPVAKKAKFLHVLELKRDLVQQRENWDVSLDPLVLKKCNKIMVTGTALLNGTLHSLLDLLVDAELVALIGPTASFLPDPLFKLGFDMLGGSIVVNPQEFKVLVSKGSVWGDTVSKFVIRKQDWPVQA